jgi:pimeloyl-ACP methyl ester carboxylesterase
MPPVLRPSAISSFRVALSEWAAAGRHMDYRGHRIFVRNEGPANAPVLLLIHGFPTASWDWEALWPQLRQRWRVVAPDLIGFGFSDKPMAYAYSLVDQADLCEAVLRHCGAESYHVLAHDYGDSVAQELLARQAPAEHSGRPRLLSMCFLNGGLFPETHRPRLIQKLLLSPLGPVIGRLSSRANIAANMRRIFGPRSQPDEALLDAFWALIAHNGGPRIAHKLIRYMSERSERRQRWVGALQAAAVPLKLIDGAADPISGSHMAARYCELVPTADVTLLEDVGHYPQIEAPQQVLAAFEEFAMRVRKDVAAAV